MLLIPFGMDLNVQSLGLGVARAGESLRFWRDGPLTSADLVHFLFFRAENPGNHLFEDLCRAPLQVGIFACLLTPFLITG